MWDFKLRSNNIYILIAFCMVLVFVLSPNIGIYDWKKELLYTEYIQESLFEQHTIPFIWWNRTALQNYPVVQQSAFFIGYPETLLFSPWIPLLFILSPAQFLKALFLIHFLIGTAGLVRLCSVLGFNQSQKRLYSALFLLSPIFFQHTAIGYYPWINLYIIPWLFTFILESDRITSAIGTAFVLALGLLQGGTHVVFWLAVLTSLYMIGALIVKIQPSHIISILLGLFCVPILSLVRIASTARVFSEFEQSFFSGYSFRAFFRMTQIPPMFFIRDIDQIENLIEFYMDGVPYWDAGTYWGLLLPLVAIIGLGLLIHRGKWSAEPLSKNLTALFLASLGCLFLSFDPLYQQVINNVTHFVSIPALQGLEKYPYRFSIPAYFGFSLAAGYYWPLATAWVHKKLVRWADLFLRSLSFIGLSKHARKISGFFFKSSASLTGIIILFRFGWLLYLKKYYQMVIRQAYNGLNWPWISRLMVNKAAVPLESYLKKGEFLLNMGVNLSLIVLIPLLLVTAIMNHSLKIKAYLQRIRKPGKQTTARVLEIMLVVPLVFACLMWLRVLTSTPLSSYDPIRNNDLNLEAVYPTGATVQLRAVSPEQVSIYCATERADYCRLTADIPFSDANLFINNPDQISFFNQSGMLGLGMPARQFVNLAIDKQPVMISFFLTGSAWILGLIMLVFRTRRNLQPPAEFK